MTSHVNITRHENYSYVLLRSLRLLCLSFLINYASVYIRDLLLLLSHVQLLGSHGETGLSGRWRYGRWVAGKGWIKKKTRTTGQTTSRIRLSLQHPPSIPHKGQEPNIQDQAVKRFKSGRTQGDYYYKQVKVRSHYLEEGTNQPILKQVLWFDDGD